MEDSIFPLVIKHLAGGEVPVREAAAEAVCALLHAHPRATHRHEAGAVQVYPRLTPD